MSEWIAGWKKIAEYLDVSVRKAQDMADQKIITVYKDGKGGVRVDINEIDEQLKKLRMIA